MILDAKIIPNGLCDIDHKIIKHDKSNINRKRPNENQKLIKIAKFKQEEVVEQLQQKVEIMFSQLSPEMGNMEDEWKAYKNTLLNIIEKLCGRKRNNSSSRRK